MFQLITRSIALAVLSLAAATTPSHASTGNVGTVHGILVNNQSGVAMFQHTGVRTNIPTCGQALPTRWVFSVATPQGQAQLALLLTAYSTGKKVVVYGTGDCADWGDTESVVYIVTQD